MKRIVAACVLVVLGGCSRQGDPRAAAVDATSGSADAGPAAAEVFERRLLPIFKSPDPSSCVQCHLAGVDIKDYILPSHEDTFVSLRDQGLIDPDRPEKSKILALIRMGEAETGDAARVHRKAREAEYAAFADWVERSAADPRLRALPKSDAGKRAGPKRPDGVIRHARKDRVLASFADNVWPMRFRCMGCHTEGTPQCDKLVKEHGGRVAWFKAGGPEATLDYLRRSRLIDAADPEKSLLLRKPLNEAEHGGGVKFVKGDQGYRAFRTFLDDYARVVKDGYPDAESLPPAEAGPSRFGTDIWLKLTNTPPAWGDKLLRVTVYARDERTKDWDLEPVATSDRVVWGKGKLWQHNLTLLAAKGSGRAAAWAEGNPSLPAGRYRIDIHVDRGGGPAKDGRSLPGADDYVGRVEVTSAWPEGYGRMTAADAAGVAK